MQDIRKFHDEFHANRNKIEQDKFILKHTSQRQPKNAVLQRRDVLIQSLSPTLLKLKMVNGKFEAKLFFLFSIFQDLESKVCVGTISPRVLSRKKIEVATKEADIF
ncbi:unnamed protein product [Psylliodes chrysocephalus]|uniref:Uncharacterized protein n=1 Tax=Psylliodes chrysocephalus TaxID=3402493 RepID=A0A9P0D701_9CUCU|nr:unnamed protein product [Psylliodes chrysocephala]